MFVATVRAYQLWPRTDGDIWIENRLVDSTANIVNFNFPVCACECVSRTHWLGSNYRRYLMGFMCMRVSGMEVSIELPENFHGVNVPAFVLISAFDVFSSIKRNISSEPMH